MLRPALLRAATAAVVLFALGAAAAGQQPRDLAAMLAGGSDVLQTVGADVSGHRLQILLTEVVDSDAGPTLVRSTLGDARQYFYPASSIKTAAAVAALLRLHSFNREAGTGLTFDSPMRIGARFAGDTVATEDVTDIERGHISIGHEIRKLLIVSDNLAFNRLYEFVGHQALNEMMWAGGYRSCRVLHRLSEFRSVLEQRQTRPTALRDGDTWHEFAARESALVLDNDDLSGTEIGAAYYARGERVDGPMSFREKNSISVRDLQDMLIEIVRPELDSGTPGFPGLTAADRMLLLDAMSVAPNASDNPRYPDVATAELDPLLPGLVRVVPVERLRIYNKTGRAYGFSIENACVEDLATGRAFFLTVVLYTNPNRTLNDDTYDYADVATPFLADLGERAARTLWGD